MITRIRYDVPVFSRPRQSVAPTSSSLLAGKTSSCRALHSTCRALHSTHASSPRHQQQQQQPDASWTELLATSSSHPPSDGMLASHLLRIVRACPPRQRAALFHHDAWRRMCDQVAQNLDTMPPAGIAALLTAERTLAVLPPPLVRRLPSALLSKRLDARQIANGLACMTLIFLPNAQSRSSSSSAPRSLAEAQHVATALEDLCRQAIQSLHIQTPQGLYLLYKSCLHVRDDQVQLGGDKDGALLSSLRSAVALLQSAVLHRLLQDPPEFFASCQLQALFVFAYGLSCEKDALVVQETQPLVGALLSTLHKQLRLFDRTSSLHKMAIFDISRTAIAVAKLALRETQCETPALEAPLTSEPLTDLFGATILSPRFTSSLQFEQHTVSEVEHSARNVMEEVAELVARDQRPYSFRSVSALLYAFALLDMYPVDAIQCLEKKLFSLLSDVMQEEPSSLSQRPLDEYTLGLKITDRPFADFSIALTLWSLARLRHDAPASVALLVRILSAYEANGGPLSLQSCSVLALSLAELGQPRDEALEALLHALAARVAAASRTASTQILVNTLFALVMHGSYPEDTMRLLLTEVAKPDRSVSALEEKGQLFMVDLALRLEAPWLDAKLMSTEEGKRLDSVDKLDMFAFLDDLYQQGKSLVTARETRFDSRRRQLRVISQLHLDMNRHLKQACAALCLEPPVMEHTESEFLFDLAILSTRLAIEADGPSHFSRNTARYVGGAMLKQRLIRKSGWRLISVPYHVWWRLSKGEERVDWLCRAIESELAVHVLPPPLTSTMALEAKEPSSLPPATIQDRAAVLSRLGVGPLAGNNARGAALTMLRRGAPKSSPPRTDKKK